MDPELENKDGLEESGSPSDNGNGSEHAASPADDSNSDSSTEEETQTSLEALSDALNEVSEDDESGKEDIKSEEKKKDDSDEDGKADSDKDNAKSDELTEEELLKPLEEGTPEKTAERFEKLTEGYKGLKEKFDTLTTESAGLKEYHDSFDALVKHSGANAQEFNDLIEYSHLVTSGNLEGALAMLDKQRADIAKAMGKPLPGINLFEGHPDLQEQIDSHELSESAAAELVKSRNIEEQRKKQDEALHLQQQNNYAQQQSTEQFNQQIETASQTIADMVGHWEKNDINFAAKQSVIAQKVEEIGQKYQPEQWAEILQLTYDAIKVDKPKAPGNKQQHNPLRPGGNGGGGTKTPTTSLGALEDALGSGF